MQIKSTLTGHSGKVLNYEYYEDIDPVQNLDGKILEGVHAYCFYDNKLVLVKHKNHGWQPPGESLRKLCKDNDTRSCGGNKHASFKTAIDWFY